MVSCLVESECSIGRGHQGEPFLAGQIARVVLPHRPAFGIFPYHHLPSHAEAEAGPSPTPCPHQTSVPGNSSSSWDLGVCQLPVPPA